MVFFYEILFFFYKNLWNACTSPIALTVLFLPKKTYYSMILSVKYEQTSWGEAKRLILLSQQQLPQKDFKVYKFNMSIPFTNRWQSASTVIGYRPNLSSSNTSILLIQLSLPDWRVKSDPIILFFFFFLWINAFIYR